MKICDYCGKQNECDAPLCFECGTTFPAVEEPVPKRIKLSPSTPRTLNAKTATIIFLATLGVDIVCGAVMAIGMILNRSPAANQNLASSMAMDRFMAVMAIAVPILTGIVTILVTFVLAP